MLQWDVQSLIKLFEQYGSSTRSGNLCSVKFLFIMEDFDPKPIGNLQQSSSFPKLRNVCEDIGLEYEQEIRLIYEGYFHGYSFFRTDFYTVPSHIQENSEAYISDCSDLTRADVSDYGPEPDFDEDEPYTSPSYEPLPNYFDHETRTTTFHPKYQKFVRCRACYHPPEA